MVQYSFSSDLPSEANDKLTYLRKHILKLLVGLALICLICAVFGKSKETITQLTTDNSAQLVTSYEQNSGSNTLDINETLKLSAKDNTTSLVSAIAKSGIEAKVKKVEESNEWKTVRVTKGDTLTKIFSKLSLPKTMLHELVHSNPKGKHLTSIHPGQELKFLFDENQQLKKLKLKLTPAKTLNIYRSEDDYHYSFEEKQITKRLIFKENAINDSLYLSAQTIDVSDKTIMQLIDIFSWDVDFAMDIRNHDSFRILFEEEFIDEQKIKTGNIVMAELINQKQTYRAVRFTDRSGRTGYYSPEGYSMQKAFLRNPLKFTRISSKFSHGRRHPVLHRIRAHKGVDYAAPAGTPIEAAGDGKVSFIGKRGGYGLVVELQHGAKYSTLYAHLSRFQKGLRYGSTVKQGQIIGYVGKTGLATGEHLHYEFRVNGVHRDPLTVKLPKSFPIDKQYRSEFQQFATEMLSLLDQNKKKFLAKR